MGVRAQNSACGFPTEIPCPGCRCREACGGGAQLETQCGWSQTSRGSQPRVPAPQSAPTPLLTLLQVTFRKVKRQRAPELSTGLGTSRGLQSDFPGVYACPSITLGISWAFGGLGVCRKSHMFVPAPHSTRKVTGRAWRTSGNSKCAEEVEGWAGINGSQASSNPGPGLPA